MDASIAHVTGRIHVPVGTDTDAERYRAWLRARGVLAAAGPTETSDRLLDLTLVTRDGRPLMLRDGGLSSPVGVLDLLTTMCRELGGLVELDPDGTSIGDPGARAPGASERPESGTGQVPDLPVLLAEIDEARLTVLAREYGVTQQSVRDGEWAAVRFEQPTTDMAWTVADLPVLWLTGHRERSLRIQLAPDGIGSVDLGRLPTPAPVLSGVVLPAEVQELLRGLANPHLGPDGRLDTVLAHPLFAEVDADELAKCLQAPMDEWWSEGVLGALRLPLGAAGLHEGRRPPAAAAGDETPAEPGPVTRPGDQHPVGDPAVPRLTPPLHDPPRAVLDELRRWEQEAPGSPGISGLLSRLYGTSVARPWLALASIIPELLIGVALLAVVATSAEHPWWQVLVVLFALLCLFDAVLDSVLLVRRIRLRRQRRSLR